MPQRKRQRSKASPKAIANTKRRKLALELRLKGLTYDQVGTELGISTSSAWKHIQAALKDTQQQMAETAEDLRTQQDQRLDMLLNALRPGIGAGDPQAINAAIRIEERRAKLRGLDAPQTTKQELSGPAGGPVQISTPTIYLPTERADSDSTGLPSSGDAAPE